MIHGIAASLDVTAQNIERQKGAIKERREIAALVRALLRLYKGDLVLMTLLKTLKERGLK